MISGHPVKGVAQCIPLWEAVRRNLGVHDPFDLLAEREVGPFLPPPDRGNDGPGNGPVCERCPGGVSSTPRAATWSAREPRSTWPARRAPRHEGPDRHEEPGNVDLAGGGGDEDAGPMGGVMRAMVMFSVTMIPRCTGSIPAPCATGREIGVSNISAETSSMNIPVTKAVAERANSVRAGLPESGSRRPVEDSGALAQESSHEMTEGIASVTKIGAVSTAVSRSERQRDSGSRLRERNPHGPTWAPVRAPDPAGATPPGRCQSYCFSRRSVSFSPSAICECARTRASRVSVPRSLSSRASRNCFSI